MSLVNDMLRDLAGQQPLQVTEHDHEQLLADSGLVRKQGRRWLPSLVLFFVALTLLIIGQLWFFTRPAQIDAPVELASLAPTVSVARAEALSENLVNETVTEGPQQNLVIEHSAPDSVVEKATVGAEEIPVNQLPVAVEANANSPATEVNSKDQLAAISAWLKLASLAIAQDRLTSPLEDSAWFYYQQVLALAPQHPQAQQGLGAITARYLQLIADIMENPDVQEQDITRAQTMLRRARLVTAEDARLDTLEVQLAQAALSLKDSVATDAPLMEQQEMQSDIKERVAKPVEEESYSLPAQTTIAAPQLQVTPNREWQDQQAAAQARLFMQQGQVERARTQLELFLQQHGSAVMSSQLLCQIYLDQGELVKAAKLLLEAEQWPVSERVRMRAQMHIAQGDNAAALVLLETHQAEAENDERYRALLASLYHTVGNFHESVASYRRLLNVFGEKSAYWLGLALALDSLDQNTSALEAYRRAYEFQPLQAEVNKYIEQRITALSR